MAESVDVLVIGAGVIGLAVAREFTLQGREVVVVEQANSIGTGTSSRNSEVIHAGIYYEPGSLKARLCVAGKTLLYDYCAVHGVEAHKVGKLIVAQSENELQKLATIKQTASLNGVDDLVELNAVQVKQLEAEVNCVAALFSPTTGIIDSTGFMLSLQGEAEQNGAAFAFRTKVVGGKSCGAGLEVELNDAVGNSTRLLCRTVINCAGHGAHQVAMSLTGLSPSHFPPRFLAKGNYCNVSGKAPFSHLVYPVPVPGALGIHVTLDLHGRVRLGPDIEWVEGENYSISDSIISAFKESCEGFWPGIRDRELSPAYAGIRPKIHGPDTSSADFHVQSEKLAGVPCLINLFGIESPGLTASLALARHVVDCARSFS